MHDKVAAAGEAEGEAVEKIAYGIRHQRFHKTLSQEGTRKSADATPLHKGYEAGL